MVVRLIDGVVVFQLIDLIIKETIHAPTATISLTIRQVILLFISSLFLQVYSCQTDRWSRGLPVSILDHEKAIDEPKTTVALTIRQGVHLFS